MLGHTVLACKSLSLPPLLRFISVFVNLVHILTCPQLFIFLCIQIRILLVVAYVQFRKSELKLVNLCYFASLLWAPVLHVVGVVSTEMPAGFHKLRVLISASPAFMKGIIFAYQRQNISSATTFFFFNPSWHSPYMWQDLMYGTDVIRSKWFPLWRMKSFICGLLRLVIREARPDCWLIGEWCCVTQPTDMQRIHFGVWVMAINLHCQSTWLQDSFNFNYLSLGTFQHDSFHW